MKSLRETKIVTALTLAAITLVVSYASVSSPLTGAEDAQLSTPSITAITKGPDQINLTWSAVSNPGYGYLVEIQSAGDSRYATWTELQPILTAEIGRAHV